jgi:hypothetical protein
MRYLRENRCNDAGARLRLNLRYMAVTTLLIYQGMISTLP